MRRAFTSHPVSKAAALAAVALISQARADNLLTNPNFEAPATDPSQCTGWTFQFDCQRATFHASENPQGGTWDIWAKTFSDLGMGGITQNVSGIVAGTNYTLSTKNYFETTYH